jgi:hypothetical protein
MGMDHLMAGGDKNRHMKDLYEYLKVIEFDGHVIFRWVKYKNVYH